MNLLFTITQRIPEEALIAAYRGKATNFVEFPVSHEEGGKQVTGTLSVDIRGIKHGEEPGVTNFNGTVVKMFGAELALRFQKIRLLGTSCAGHASEDKAEGQIKVGTDEEPRRMPPINSPSTGFTR